VPTPVSDGKHLYVLHDNGSLSCLNPQTGEPYYKKQRLPRGTYSASPLLAEGRVYVTSENGKTTVLATGPEFTVLATNDLEDGYTLSSIAVAGSEFFIRTSTHLYRISKQK
jgi:outer membrane protein assembly factor BamB